MVGPCVHDHEKWKAPENGFPRGGACSNMRAMSVPGLRIGIAGGSIAGLAAAAALVRAGAKVTVFERTSGRDRSLGAGMGVDLDLLRQVTEEKDRALPHLALARRRVDAHGKVVDERTAVTVSAYHLLRDHLRATVSGDRYVEGQEVVSIDAPAAGDLRLRLAGGDHRNVDAVIVADGRRSRLRGLVAQHEKERYAGYVLVRGFVPEAALPAASRACLLDDPALHIVVRGRYQLVAYAVPGEKGEVGAGARRLNFGWYYGATASQLRDELIADPTLAEDAVLGAFTPSPSVADALVDEAEVLWPPAYAALIRAAREAGALSVHPVYEHVPDRLASGRIALVGDAAHLSSPITGSGARMALLDALALSESLAHEGLDVISALRRYHAVRLAPSVAIVAHGSRAGAPFRAA
jgi:2-polyprenyl-6-methoxyphenol hydroxylase-like FAD-dependent oxidoreductase